MPTQPQAIKKTTKKKVQFFQIYQLNDGRLCDLEPTSWSEVLAQVQSEDVNERTIDTIIFDPHVDEQGVPTLGMFKPLSTDFMSRINPDTKEVTDIDVSEQELFAHSAAAVFLDDLNVVGIVGSSGTLSPQHTAIKAFLTKFMPLGRGRSWEIEPLMDPAKLKQFAKADGVTEFEAKYRSAGDIFTPRAGNALEFGDHIANTLGEDVEIKVTVKLKGAKSKDSKQRFKDMVTSSLDRIAHDPESGARVKATSGMMDEELNLVARKFSVEDEIPDVASERATFTLLMDMAKRVTAECKGRIEELRKG